MSAPTVARRAPFAGVLAVALALAGAGCSTESAPPGPSAGPTEIEADCLDLQQGGRHLALAVVDGLHPLEIKSAALNPNYAAGDGVTVRLLAWVLLGAREQKDADGEVFVYGTDRTAKFPATESLRRSIIESAGPARDVKDLDLGRARVAGKPAETASVSSPNGQYDAWTFTSGGSRFVVVTQQKPHSDALDLAERVPRLLAAGECTRA